jgi:hypothetical protein
MSKSRYMLMTDSDSQVDSNGIPRIDILTFPINDFKPQDILLDWTLSEDEVYRFDIFILKHYGSTNYYLPMIKWFNGLFEMDDRWIGKEIKLVSKEDLDRFLRSNIVKLERG